MIARLIILKFLLLFPVLFMQMVEMTRSSSQANHKEDNDHEQDPVKTLGSFKAWLVSLVAVIMLLLQEVDLCITLADVLHVAALFRDCVGTVYGGFHVCKFYIGCCLRVQFF